MLIKIILKKRRILKRKKMKLILIVKKINNYNWREIILRMKKEMRWINIGNFYWKKWKLSGGKRNIWIKREVINKLMVGAVAAAVGCWNNKRN